MGRFLDLTGQRFGRLVVVKCTKKNKNSYWECKCDCGNITVVCRPELVYNRTRSCGCLRDEMAGTYSITHGACVGEREKLYGVWKQMRQRCRLPSNNAYKNYGGRGITVCSEWEDYSIFRSWAYSHGYEVGLTIERRDNDKEYSPFNCVFVSLEKQQRNTRKNHLITYNQKTKTLAEWSEIMGFPSHLIRQRLKRGWTPQEALTMLPMNAYKTRRLS